jgi:hypothetical protein
MFTFTNRLLLILGLVFCLIAGYSQPITVATQNFDGGTGQLHFTSSATGLNGWTESSQVYANGAKSMYGEVPATLGASKTLTSDVIDVSGNAYPPLGLSNVQLRFKHICKISPSDSAKVQIKLNVIGAVWEDIPYSCYQGTATNYLNNGFDAASYSLWQSRDSLAFPNNSWWKEEVFDLSQKVSYEGFQVRFVIKRGNVMLTNVSAGWYIDNFEIIGNDTIMKGPVVKWSGYHPSGEVFNVGPFTVQASVKQGMLYPLGSPTMTYTSYYNGTIVSNTVNMTYVGGKDAIWKADLPQYVANTIVAYSVTVADSAGNHTTLSDGYTVSFPKTATGGSVIIGTGTNQTNYPFMYYYGYSQCVTLYRADEIGNIRGAIDSIGLNVGQTTPYAAPIKIYVLEVPSGTYTQLTTSAATWSDYVQMATLVYDGKYTFNRIGWTKIPLQDLFVYQGGDILIFWDYAYGGNGQNTYPYFIYTTTGNYTFYRYSNATPPSTNAGGYITTARPNLFLSMRASADITVDMHAILIPDTVVTNPSWLEPVTVQIHNFGFDTIVSAKLGWSLNGQPQPVTNWTGIIPWDFYATVNIGTFHPTANQRDTITTWVSLPNGVADVYPADDTLQKIIFGSADLRLELVKRIIDTTYSTGPHKIYASIRSLSGQPIGNVYLYTEFINTGVSTYDTLPMAIDPENGYYLATVQNLPYNSHLRYSITLTDFMNNTISIKDSFFVKRLNFGGRPGDHIFGAADSTSGIYYGEVIYRSWDASSWSRSLYPASDVGSNVAPRLIEKIAWYNSGSNLIQTRANLKVYMKAVATNNNPETHLNPVTNGATLVYDAPITSSLSWNSITLQTPFVLPKDSNLFIYFEENSGTIPSPSGYIYWSTSGGKGGGGTVADDGYGWIYTMPLPVMKFTYGSGSLTDSNSVAMESFYSITSTTGMTAAVSVPLTVTIRNRGIKPLDSCYLNWSLNGVVQAGTIVYHGHLQEGYTDTITIGTYQPIANQIDTIMVWTSMPNGVVDSADYDDTIIINPVGCAALSGTMTVMPGGDFGSLDAAFTVIRQCGLSGDLNLAIKGNHTGSYNMTALNKFLNGYHLTLSSYDNNPDSAVFTKVGGAVFMFGDNRNITLKGLRINTIYSSNSQAYGIQFSSACTNITVRDCFISADTTGSSGAYPIYKASGTGVCDSIFIIHNEIVGGYYGIYFYGETSYSTNILIDSNTIRSQYYASTYIYYTDLVAFSHNTILSRLSSGYNYWYATMIYYSNGPIVCNRILQRSTEIMYPYGLYLSYYNINATATDTGLIANNEISIYTSSSYYGAYLNNVRTKFINNTIYVRGGGSAMGIYVPNSTSTVLHLYNNNVIMEATSAYPIYLVTTSLSATYQMDWNNWYAPKFVGYFGGTVRNIADWRSATGKDANTSTSLTQFSDNFSLRPTNYQDLFTPTYYSLTNDIEDNTRNNPTLKGCYEIPYYTADGALYELLGVAASPQEGQSDTMKVSFYNLGNSLLTSVNLGWSINGVVQNSNLNYSFSLNRMQNTVLTLGNLTYSFGSITVKVWINSINNGSIMDAGILDDTLTVDFYGCRGQMSGTWYIGNTSTADFASVKDANRALTACGINGDITFAFLSGQYYESIDLSDNELLFKIHNLTLTSVAENADSVSIHPIAGAGIMLGNSLNTTIKNITINQDIQNNHAVQFISACTNIVIRDCKLIVDSTSTASGFYPIYKPNTAGVLDSVFFIHNVIVGGYYGVYLYGVSTSAFNQNIVFDSNTVKSTYYYGCMFYYNNRISIKNNTISRRNNGTTSWYGLYIYYLNGWIVGNHVYSGNIQYPYGVLANYIHTTQASTSDTSLIANNEVIISGSGSYYAYGLSYAKVRFLNNSAYVGGSSTMRGLYIANSTTNNIEAKNNNIVMASPDAYPIYFSATGNLNLYKFGNNNYYAPKYVGYYGSNQPTLADWQSATGLDTNSMNINPLFFNSTNSLLMMSNTGLTCPPIYPISTDIDGTVRNNPTSVGCYETPSYNCDLMLNEIYDISPGAITGANDSVKVIVFNKGTTTITSVNLGWSLNGVTQDVGTNYPVNLPQGAMDTIYVGTVTYPAVASQITVWINTINNGALTDELPANDTVTTTVVHCNVTYSGTLVVGTSATADFPTIEAAMEGLRTCAGTADVILALESGTYTQNLNMAQYAGIPGRFHLTITSLAGNADSVIFKPTAGVALTLGNDLSNVTFKNITFDGIRTTTHTLQFTSACKNIIIRDCKILQDSTTNSSNKYCIYKGSSNPAENVYFINNLIDGGYYTVYFYGGTNQTNAMGKNIVFDSNVIQNGMYYAMFLYYGQFYINSNIIYNRIGTTNVPSYWYPSSVYYSDLVFTNNRIKQRGAALNELYSSFNYLNQGTDTGLIANNEFNLNCSYGYPLYFYGYSSIGGVTKLNVYHNSVYNAKGGSEFYGIYIDNYYPMVLNIKNNNLVLSGGRPIMCYYTNFEDCDFDYNNLYSPSSAGYIGNMNQACSLTEWQELTGMDAHSIAKMPTNFNNLAVDLSYSGTDADMFCVYQPSVPNDITGDARLVITSKGCYNMPPLTANATMVELLDLSAGSLSSQSINIRPVFTNTGNTTITGINLGWSLNGVIQNGSGTNFPVNLTLGQSDTVNLGSFITASANSDIKVWINSINNGLTIDNYAGDDTLIHTIQYCTVIYSGVVTIGTSGDFATLSDAFNAFKICGVAGDITLSILPDTLTSGIDLRRNGNYFGNYTLTITSSTNNANDVVIRPTEGNAFLLGKSQNVIIKNLNIDMTVSSTNGIQFDGSCSNITIRNCKIFCDTTVTNDRTNPIWISGVKLDSIYFINNWLEGGYFGIYFYGTGSTNFSTNIVMDSNTILNFYYYGIYGYYLNLNSCSYNRIYTRTANYTSYCYSIALQYTNGGPIIGNRLVQRASMQYPYGMYLYYYNSQQYSNDTGLVANNEIISHTTNYSAALYYCSRIKFINNSIYNASSSGKGIYVYNSTTPYYFLIKNNNVVTPNGYPVYFSSNANKGDIDLDYNNYYSQYYVGYFGGGITSMSAWRSTLGQDMHSVQTPAFFTNPTEDLSLMRVNYLTYCPSSPLVTKDINDIVRPATTIMGAYHLNKNPLDAAITSYDSWKNEVIRNEDVSVYVKLQNAGTIPLNSAKIKWTVNGAIQPTYTWTSGTPVDSMQEVTIQIGTYHINAIDNQYQVVVWVDSINNQRDTINWNDTARATSRTVLIAEFTTPKIADTTYVLSPNVYIYVRNWTGAPVQTPKLHYTATLGEFYSSIDSVNFFPLPNNRWMATIPEQYYGTKILFHTTIEDTLGNSITLLDSTVLKAGEGLDTIAITGSGGTTNYYNPYSYTWDYSQSRNYYRNWEFNQTQGGFTVSSIAFYVTSTAASSTDNISFYMKADADSIIRTTGYIDPIADGAQLVWGSATSSVSTIGWKEYILDTPFDVPAGMNLLIYCESKDGSYGNNGSVIFQQSNQSINTSFYCYQDGAWPPTQNMSLTNVRPHIRIVGGATFMPYTQTDLALLAFTEPQLINSSNLCTPDISSVKVKMANYGANTLDFGQDNVTLTIEVTNPLMEMFTTSITLNNGILHSGEFAVQELIPTYSTVMAGNYFFKAWLTCAIDGIVYDDTITYIYSSGRKGLPIEEDFSGGMPNYMRVENYGTTQGWQVTQKGYNADSTTVFAQNGNMMAFVANRGAVSRLITDQLDLSGTLKPVFTFFYWHDTANVDATDYTLVQYTIDGGATWVPLRTVYKFLDPYTHGWVPYSVDLSSLTSESCVIIAFEAMEKHISGKIAQYISEFGLVASQDIAVSEIFTENLNACNMKGTLKVKLSNKTAQDIYFLKYPTILHVNITGAMTQNLTFPLNNGSLEGLQDSIFIVLDSFEFTEGNYNVIAYIESMDDSLYNDTLSLPLSLVSSLNIILEANTNPANINSCLTPDMLINQNVVIHNTGAMTVEDIILKIDIFTNAGVVETLQDTLYGILMPGDSIMHTMSHPYTVPLENLYNLYATATLLCGSSLTENKNLQECADATDLAIVSFESPIGGTTDEAGASMTIKVKIRNYDPANDYYNVGITAIIDDGLQYTRHGSFDILTSSDAVYEFPAYTVPNNEYTISVYLDNIDNHPYNDTLKIARNVNLGTLIIGKDGISLSQNIPNPASNTTKVEYSLPHDGKAVFNIYTTAGQVIYTQSVDATVGKNNIIFDLNGLSSGIYFYSLEFEGQKLVRKMSVK